MARAKKEQRPLPDFEGKEVISSRITIPNMGGGLNDALDVDPVALEIGEEGWGVFHWVCRAADHVPYKKNDFSLLTRDHVLNGDSVMIVTTEEDIASVKLMLAARADEVQRAKDSMKGQGRIDDEVPDDELSPEELEVRNKLKGIAGKP